MFNIEKKECPSAQMPSEFLSDQVPECPLSALSVRVLSECL